jgi:hypothetical protein
MLINNERNESQEEDYFDDDPFKNFGEDMGEDEIFSEVEI